MRDRLHLFQKTESHHASILGQSYARSVVATAREFSSVIRKSAVERGLPIQALELIKLRTSQINQCAFCLGLHSREARRARTPQQKLDLLPAWREVELFDDRHRAVLSVAEAATLVLTDRELEDDLSSARAILGVETFVAAEWVAVTINAFNRISISSGHQARPRDAKGVIER